MKNKRQLTNIRVNIYKTGHTGNTTTTLKHVRDKLLSAGGKFQNKSTQRGDLFPDFAHK